jgi:hypothetical protein
MSANNSQGHLERWLVGERAMVLTGGGVTFQQKCLPFASSGQASVAPQPSASWLGPMSAGAPGDVRSRLSTFATPRCDGGIGTATACAVSMAWQAPRHEFRGRLEVPIPSLSSCVRSKLTRGVSPG